MIWANPSSDHPSSPSLGNESLAHHGWLHAWQVLSVSFGIIPSPVIPAPQLPTSETRPRSIPIHSYCLQAVRQTATEGYVWSNVRLRDEFASRLVDTEMVWVWSLDSRSCYERYKDFVESVWKYSCQLLVGYEQSKKKMEGG